MHGTILVLAKKKAAGPGGYFDPMQEPAPMAMGPMVFEMSKDNGEEPKSGEYDVPTADMAKGSPSMTLLEIADALEKSSTKHAAQAEALRGVAAMLGNEMESEDEPTGEEPKVEAKPAPMAKKPFPGFDVKKEMKY